MRLRLVTVEANENGDEMRKESEFIGISDFLSVAEVLNNHNEKFHHFEIQCLRSSAKKEEWLGMDMPCAFVPKELRHLYGTDNLQSSIMAQIGLQVDKEDIYPVTILGGFDWFLIPFSMEEAVTCTMLELSVHYLDDVKSGQRIRTLGACMHHPTIQGEKIPDIDFKSLNFVDAIIDDYTNFGVLQDIKDPKSPYLEPLIMLLKMRRRKQND